MSNHSLAFEKLYCFSDVQDINEVLEVTVLDENKFRKFDFLGKVCQSLLPNMQQLFLDLDPSYYSKEW